MWRIHLGTGDLARVRLAAGADPMWELMHSVHVFGSGFGDPVFGRWRRRRTRLGPETLTMLTALAPPTGYSPDFLTPVDGTTDLGSGIEAVLRTPRRSLHSDIARLAQTRRLPAWTTDLAAGRPAYLRELSHQMERYFDAVLTPYWGRIRRQIRDELHHAAGQLSNGGVERLLSTASPLLRWQAPVLEILNKSADRDIHPAGHGLLLQPSFFAYDDVTVLHVPDKPVVLAYPIRHQPGWCVPRDPATSSLEPLLGRTRSHTLHVLADGALNTSQLAAQLGVSVASASQHTSTLREAGLIVSSRQGRAVVHRNSAIGTQLLDTAAAGRLE